MGIKPKTSFRHCIPIRCSRWVASHPTHIPRRPKKKPLRGKKVGFAEKKLRLTQKMAHRVYQGWHVPTCGDLPQPTLRGSLLRLRLSPSCARLRLACMELSTIRHLRWRVCASRRFDKLDKFVTSKNNNGRRVPSLGCGAGHKKSLQLFFLEGELQAMVYEERVV